MRIGILADVNLNAIDGSSLWVQSVAEAIERCTVHTPIVISKRRIDFRRPIPSSLRTGGFTVIEPHHLDGGHTGEVASLLRSPTLAALELDVLVVRGINAVLAASATRPSCGQLWGYVTEFDQLLYQDRRLCGRLFACCRGVDRLLIQTELARDVLCAVPGIEPSKLAVLPPILNKDYHGGTPASQRRQEIVYAGKFAPDWGLECLNQIAHQLMGRQSEIPVRIFGDKVHDPTPNQGFTHKIEAMQAEATMEWCGAIPRQDVIRVLQESRYSWAWRQAALESRTVELSSKMLEACVAGCFPLCYPNAANRQVLGEDYPLFVHGAEDAGRAIEAFETQSAADMNALQDRVRQSVSAYLDREVITALFRQLLPQNLVSLGQQAAYQGKKRLLIAGHDLKFATGIARDLQTCYEVTKQNWSGHDDQELRKTVVSDGFDIVWCEWCLGNAAHYSSHVSPEQKLFIRFHLQEFDTPWPGRVDIANVTRVIFVNAFHRDMAISRYGWPPEKLTVIPNYIEPTAYFGSKPVDNWFNIGMIGVVPARKRLDRALDLLERLLADDDRWILWIKGKRPQDYPWLVKRAAEMAYFEECTRRIEESPQLRDHVRFVDAGPDVALFLRQMGWVLSPSDFESFHLAIVEGGAAGAYPLVWNWDAAASIYPDAYIVEDTVEAERVIRSMTPQERAEQAQRFRDWVVTSFSVSRIATMYIALFEHEVET